MNYSTSVFLINKHVRAIVALYEDQPHAKPTMFKTLDTSIAKDDLVVVPTETRHGMTVVKVTEVDADVDFDSTVPMKWVIQKVERKTYDDTLAQEAVAIETIKSAVIAEKRKSLAAAMMADAGHAGAIKALALADLNGDAPPAAA